MSDLLLKYDENSNVIKIDSEVATKLGFTSDLFYGYLWSDNKDSIHIPLIISKIEGSGNFSKLIRTLKENYSEIVIPNPSKKMLVISGRLGFKLLDRELIWRRTDQSLLDILNNLDSYIIRKSPKEIVTCFSYNGGELKDNEGLIERIVDTNVTKSVFTRRKNQGRYNQYFRLDEEGNVYKKFVKNVRKVSSNLSGKWMIKSCPNTGSTVLWYSSDGYFGSLSEAIKSLNK